MLFEWDEAKREANLAKHGLDLLRGAELFDGRPVYTYPSPRGDELRLVTVGLAAEQFVALVWTRRGEAVRLISLRRARGGERDAYRACHG